MRVFYLLQNKPVKLISDIPAYTEVKLESTAISPSWIISAVPMLSTMSVS